MYRKSICLLLLVFLFFPSNPVWSQLPHEIADIKNGEELFFRHITRENGLPSNVVRCITQDFIGYMWFGTENGLVRFDGNKMKIFQYIPGDSTSITESSILSLFVSSDSLLWIGTINGFSVYNPFTGKFENHKNQKGIKNSFPGTEIRSFWEDRDKTIWIATNNGVVQYNRKNKTYTLSLDNMNPGPEKIKRLRFTYNIVEDPRDQTRILVTTAGGLIQMDKNSHQITHEYEKDKTMYYRTQSVYIEGDSVFWTGEWATGLKRFDLKKETWELYHFKPGYPGSVLFITKKNEDEFWIATPVEGLVVFNKKDKTFRYYEHDPSNPKSLLSNSTNCNLFYDKNQNLWIGGDEGINMLDKQYHSFKRVEIPMDFGYVRTFFRDKAGKKMYFGVKGKHNLISWDEKKRKWDYISQSSEIKPNARVNNIYKDKSGKIWVTTVWNGLLYIDSSTNTLRCFRTEDGHPLALDTFYQTVNFIAEDKTENLWLSTTFDGIIRINRERTKATYFKHDSTNINSLRYGTNHFEIEIDKKNRIWIGSYNGFDVYDIDNEKFLHYIADSLQNLGIKNSHAFSFENDSLGRMWVSMPGEGLLRITENNRKFEYKIFHGQHGFNDLTIDRMTTDPDGNLWIINRGLVKFNPYTEAIQVFDKRNGLWQTKTADDRIYIDYEGNIFLTSENCYETIKYNKTERSTGIINLVLEGIEVNGSKYIDGIQRQEGNRYIFEADQKNLNFLFTAICFRDIDQVQYKYKLVGYQEDWSLPTKISSARYTNLLPGNYEFIVKVAFRGVWLDYQKSVKFTIRPYFWQRTWFRILAGLLIISVFYLFYSIKIRQIKREEKIKTEFQNKIAEVEMQALRAQMNPHFIFNSLNSINTFILKNETEKASDFLTKFSRLVRQVLNNSKNKMVTLEDEFAALGLYIELEQLRFSNKFEYEIRIDNMLDTTMVLIPPLLIQPYVENAIWHGLMHKETNGNIKIEVQKDHDKLIFGISDDGIGRKKAAEYKSLYGIKKKSMGMNITSDRIAILNKMFNMKAKIEITDLNIDNPEATGTKVTISIPVITKES